jgi:hypothetical protein
MIKKKLIFYQSVSEISEIIELIKKSPYGTFIIIITGGAALTKVIKKIKLKKFFGVTIYEFHALKLKNPFNILRMIFRFNYSQDVKKVLSHSYKEVFFFNFSYDFVTPIFLSKIDSKNFTFIDFYKRKLVKGRPGLKEIIQKIVIKILHINTNISMTYDMKYNQIHYFPIGKKINEVLLINKMPKPIFELPIPNNKKYILYFDSNEEQIYGNKFKKIILKIFDLAENAGFNVIIKKHPVAELSNCIKGSKKWIYISDPIPIELYNLKNIQYVLGLTTLSLAKVAEKYPNIIVLSFLNILGIKKNLSHMTEYLKKMMNSGVINYPDNFNDIKKQLNLKNKKANN